MQGDRWRPGDEWAQIAHVIAATPHPLTELAVAQRALVVGASTRTPDLSRPRNLQQLELFPERDATSEPTPKEAPSPWR